MIAKNNITTILFYPHVFNPFAWLPGLFALVCFFAIVLFVNKRHHRRILREAFHSLATMFINSVWYHKKKSVAFAHYLKSQWLPFYPYNDWRTHKAIETEYNYYKRVR